MFKGKYIQTEENKAKISLAVAVAGNCLFKQEIEAALNNGGLR